jgi:hypothetical protein
VVESADPAARLVATAIVFWVTAGVLGMLGFAALERRNNLLLCVYVVACVMTGAALAVYSLLVVGLYKLNCIPDLSGLYVG